MRYLKGLVRTYQWLYDNKDEAVEATSSVAKLEKKLAMRGYEIYTKRQVWPTDGSPSIDGMRVVLDYMRHGENARFIRRNRKVRRSELPDKRSANSEFVNPDARTEYRHRGATGTLLEAVGKVVFGKRSKGRSILAVKHSSKNTRRKINPRAQL